jgi:hypothetical protein
MEVSLQVAKAPAEGEQVREEDILMTCVFTMVWNFPLVQYRNITKKARFPLIR